MEEIKRIYLLLLQSGGLRIREISNQLGLDKSHVADILFSVDGHNYWFQNEYSSWFAKEGALDIVSDEEDDEEVDFDDYYDSEVEDTDEEYLPIDIILPKNIELERYVDGEGSNSLRAFLSEALKYRQLTNEEFYNLITSYKRGDLNAYDILVKSNLKLVVNIARIYKEKGIPFEDLIQEGVIGLLRGIEKINSSYYGFVDYLKSYVLQAISTAFTFLPHLIKIPANQIFVHRKVRKFMNHYELKYGYEPSLIEIEDSFCDEVRDIESVNNLPTDLLDLTYSFNEWDDIECDDISLTEIACNQEYSREYVKMIFKSLSSREILILKKYYGIDEVTDLSLDAIADELSLTRERVRQIYTLAKNKIREKLHINDDFDRIEEKVVVNVKNKVRVIPDSIPLQNDIPNLPINIEYQLCTMKTARMDGYKSPHKAIYILTLIKGVCENFINPDKIELNSKLIDTYNSLWDKYAPDDTPFTKDIANPYIHLSTDKFYQLHLLRTVNISDIRWSINTIRKFCDYAYLNYDFYEYILNESNRKWITNYLIKVYDLKSDEPKNTFDKPVVTNHSTSKPIETKFIPEKNTTMVIVPSLPKPKIPNRHKAAIFRLTYPNGFVEESDDYMNTYLNFIKYANPKSVRDLNIYYLGTNIIVGKDEINSKYEKIYKDVGDGLYFNTSSATQKKYEIMSFISEQLKLNIKVELVAKPQNKQRTNR